MASKLHQWFKKYSHFTEGVDFAYCWSCLWKGLRLTSVSEGFFLKCPAIFFRQENVNQKIETHPVKFYFTKQLLFITI